MMSSIPPDFLYSFFMFEMTLWQMSELITKSKNERKKKKEHNIYKKKMKKKEEKKSTWEEVNYGIYRI